VINCSSRTRRRLPTPERKVFKLNRQTNGE
jgi:hypothetical protein